MSRASRSASQQAHGALPSAQSSNKIAEVVSPSKRAASHVRTEAPKEPPNIYHAFEEARDDISPVGNKDFEFMLKAEGKLGLFFRREQYSELPIYLELQPEAYRLGAYRTLCSILLRAHRLQGHIENEEVTSRVTEVATQLSYGICLASYMKLRLLHGADLNQQNKFLTRPRFVSNFDLPQPYALAVSHLGVIKVSGLQTVTKVSPTLSAAAAANYMLPDNVTWNLQAHNRAVEYAKKLGLKFVTPDLSMKIGSSWWLYDNNDDNEIVTLRCRLPEDNFTPQTAVIACLFAAAENDGFVNPIVDLTPLGDADYGNMLRDPPPELNVTCYLVLNDESEEAWKLD